MDDSLHGFITFAFPEDSELRGVFNHHIIQLRQSGALNRMRRKWFQGRQKEFSGSGPEITEGMPLGYANLSFPFLMLCGGIAFAGIAWTVERLLKRFGVGIKRG